MSREIVKKRKSLQKTREDITHTRSLRFIREQKKYVETKPFLIVFCSNATPVIRIDSHRKTRMICFLLGIIRDVPEEAISIVEMR